MLEGNIYVCCWTADGGLWRLRTGSGRRKFEASGSDFQSALDRLTEKIGNATGDGEPRFTYDPPLPAPDLEKQWVPRHWALLQTEADIWIEGPKGRYFTGGACHLCHGAIGSRNDEPLEAGAGEGQVCGVIVRNGGIDPSKRLVVSDRFLALLHPKERAKCEWRRVRRGTRARVKFLECIPEHFAPWTAVRGWENAGYQCQGCGRASWQTLPPGSDRGSFDHLFHYTSTSAIPSTSTAMFVLGDPGDYQLVLPRTRLLRLIHDRGSIGMSIADFGAIPDSMAGATPVLSKFPR
jgi:hypothetical protein